MVEQILAMVQNIVTVKLNRVSVSWGEVEEIYASGKYPEINAEIDYIVDGKKIQKGA